MDYSHYPQLYFGFVNNQAGFYNLDSNLFSDIDPEDLLNYNNNIFNCGIYQSSIQRKAKPQRLKKRERLINNYINNIYKEKFINNSNNNINENRLKRQNIIYDNTDQRPNMIYNNINNNIISSYKTISNKPNTIIHIYQPIYKDSHNHKKYNSMNSKRITSNNNLTDINLRNRMINMKMKSNLQLHNNFNNYDILNYNEKNLYKNRQKYNSYGKRVAYHQPIQRVKSNYMFNIKNINQNNIQANNKNHLTNNDLLDINYKNNNFNAKNNNSLKNLNIFRKNQVSQRNNSNSNINRKISAHINKNDDENENLSKLAEDLINTFKKNKIKKSKKYKSNTQSERYIRKEKSEFGCHISINENNKNEKKKPEMKEEGIDIQNSLLQYISPLDSHKSSNKEEDIKENNLEINDEKEKETNINENIGILYGSKNNEKDNDNDNNEYECKQNNIKIKNNNNDKESENKKSKIKRHIKLDLDNNTYFNFLIDDLIKYCQFKIGVDGDLGQFEEREIPGFDFKTRKDFDLKPAIKEFNKNDIKINKKYIPCENLREEEIIPELYNNEITNEELTEKLIKELAISLESSIEKNLNNSRQSINQSNSQSYNQSYNQSYSDVYDSTNTSNNNNLNSSTIKSILGKLSNSRFDIIEEKTESEIDEEK